MPGGIQAAGAAEHLNQRHLLVTAGHRVDEQEAVPSTDALRGQQFGSGDVEKVALEIVAQAPIKPAGPRWRMA